MKSYKPNVKSERILKDIHRVLLRMEKRLDIIESMMYVDEVAKKQILKGNE